MNHIEALDDIVAWSQDRPLWQRAALQKLCNYEDLTEDDINLFIRICKGETDAAIAISSTDIKDKSAISKKVILNAIHAVENVNALASMQRLQFEAAGLTIIYGDNGSGKSGYIRILKNICRARSLKDEIILGNIYNDNISPSKAKISYVVNDQNREIEWINGQLTDGLLSSISVFDAAAASVHVDATNDVAYAPFALELLRKLVEACKGVKGKLQAEIDILKELTPEVLKSPKCSISTPVGQLINKLNPNTQVDVIEKLIAFTEAEDKKYSQLCVDLAIEPNKIVRDLQTKLTRLRQILLKKSSIESAMMVDNHIKLKELKTAYIICRDVANITANELFKNEPLPNVGGDLWKALWDAAKRYSENVVYINQAFPVVDDYANCVLCQQRLLPDAVERMHRFQAFIMDDAKLRERESLKTYNDYHEQINSNSLKITEVRSFYEFCNNEIEDKELSSSIRNYFIKAKWRLRAILNMASDLPPIPLWIDERILNEIASIEKRIVALTAEDNIQLMNTLSNEKIAFDDKKWLKIVKEDVLAEISRKTKIQILEGLIKQTVTTAITSKSTEISDSLVTNALRAQFAKEIDHMKLASLAIELKQERSSYGSPQFKVAMTRKPSIKVGQILSEGEFRCIALAAFLAELSTTQSQSSIVLDDPVSSLDHKHREAVAKRLAKESAHRQVIIFTHNIEFLFLLDEACRKEHFNINYRHITKRPDNSATGLCHNDAPPKAQNVNTRIAGHITRLNKEKIHYESGDDSKWEETVRNLQKDIRYTWERAIEDIISVVLYRFSNKVETRGLSQLSILKLEDCEAMREAYGRVSSWLHSDGIGLNRNLPSENDISLEIQFLKNWYEDLKKRQVDLQKINKN